MGAQGLDGPRPDPRHAVEIIERIEPATGFTIAGDPLRERRADVRQSSELGGGRGVDVESRSEVVPMRSVGGDFRVDEKQGSEEQKAGEEHHAAETD